MISHQIVGIVVAVGIVAPAAYIALDREPCVVITSSELLTPEVYPGGTLRWRITLDRNDVCEYHRTSFLKDGANAVIPYAPFDLASDGLPERGEEMVLNEVIPEGATPGPAEYFRWGQYRRSVVNDYWPLPPVLIAHYEFTILDPKEKPDE